MTQVTGVTKVAEHLAWGRVTAEHMIAARMLSSAGYMRFIALLGFFLFPLIPVARAQVSPEGQAYLDCHSTSTPGILEQWRESAHAKKNVDCYSCHRANEKDPATFEHYGHRIAVIVTPTVVRLPLRRKLCATR
jgi:hypothetical protein